MMSDKSVVIVGAGIGGVATSIALAKNGYRVRVYEKRSYAGGRCGRFEREGHRFDIGATLVLMPSIYREVFEYLDLNFSECLKLQPLDTIYTLYFGKNRKFDFTTDKTKMKEQLEAFEPGSFKSYQKYISAGYDFYEIAMNKLLNRNYFRLSEFLCVSNFRLLLQMKAYIRHSNYIKRFFRNSDLQKAFTFQNIYVGQSPYQAPAFFSMLSAAELTEGTVYPFGGMYSIVEKLVEIAKGYGVEFYFNRTVEKIIAEGNAASEIELSDSARIHADTIIVNADLPVAYKNLLPDKRKAKRIYKKKYSCSAFVFHWGMDQRFKKLGHHSIFLSDEYRINLKKIFRDKTLASNPNFYVHAPARTDETAAPPGMDTISVIVPVGHISDKHDQPWDEFRDIARKSVIRRLEDFGLDDLERHIKFEVCYTPHTWENSYCVAKGGVFGSLSHSMFQMGYFRPGNRHRKYRNLYFVGGSTHPGNGVPLVLLSAKLTSERILLENS